jgi:hypothetical protein
MPAALTSCPAVLALELEPSRAPSTLTLALESAPLLAEAIAADLGRLLPGVETMALAVAAALYDQAQVLRPGWPLHAELARLQQQAQRGGFTPLVASFGASAGRMATPVLEPDPRLIGSPLLLVPFVLVGHGADAEAVGARMERDFEEKGLADSRTALFANEAFSIQVEHARYLTHHDLCALAAMQYEHAGFAPLWSILECALLSPSREERVTLADGVVASYRDGRVALAGDPRLPAVRQAQAVFAAHGLTIDTASP